MKGGLTGMAPADKRIVIRDIMTGELRHGIRGHIPLGWYEVRPTTKEGSKAAEHTVEAQGSSNVRSGQEHGTVVHESVQAVRNKAGDESGDRTGNEVQDKAR